MQCWGKNDKGPLGDGTMMDSTSPVSVSTITNAVTIAGGQFCGCALLGDHSVSCWGLSDGSLACFGVNGLETVPSIALW